MAVAHAVEQVRKDASIHSTHVSSPIAMAFVVVDEEPYPQYMMVLPESRRADSADLYYVPHGESALWSCQCLLFRGRFDGTRRRKRTTFLFGC